MDLSLIVGPNPMMFSVNLAFVIGQGKSLYVFLYQFLEIFMLSQFRKTTGPKNTFVLESGLPSKQMLLLKVFEKKRSIIWICSLQLLDGINPT